MSITLWVFLAFLAYLGYSIDFFNRRYVLYLIEINKIDRAIDCLRKNLSYFSIKNLYLK